MIPSTVYDKGMKATRKSLGDQIRAAVNQSGMSRYAICKAAGIDQASFSRFMAGKVGLTLASLDRLAAVLGLFVVARGPVRVSPPAKPGRKPKKER